MLFPTSLNRRGLLTLILVTLLPSSAVLLAHSQRAELSREVEQTFVFFGCNRVDAKDWEVTKRENPSSANIPQLKQNLTDAAQLAPDTLFFGGDLVMGYADDHGETLRSQMTAWIDSIKKMPHASKTRYVAITGNHELNRKIELLKLPNLVNDAVWTKLVKKARLVPANAKGPTPQSSPHDHLATDQRALSFGFDRGSVHFVVLNTDTRVTTQDAKTGETKIGMVPVHWLESDLDRAENNPRIKAVVILAHRNLIDPASVKGDAPIDPECAAPMIKVLDSHPKVRAYICAHVHAFDITSIGTSGVQQVVFGNGGSPLEKNWKPDTGRTFGFGYFKVYRDGSLGIVPYFRPEPENYLTSSPELVPPAKPEPELIIAPRSVFSQK